MDAPGIGRHLLAAMVISMDTALLVAGRPGAEPLWVISGYALLGTLIVVLRQRSAPAAFASTLALAALSGAGHILLIWASYQAGREISSRSRTAVAVGAAMGSLGGQIAVRPADPRGASNLVFTYLVFVVLPLLAGRYLAQHERLVTALDQHNRQLRAKREMLAEQERLRERLRIARDMHDSLGHRLSLVSIQAAALEVAALPPPQRQAVGQLARSARDAMDELYELVGALRGEDETGARAPGMDAIDPVVAEFRAAGMPVALRRQGRPRPLSAAAGRAAYRVVEEGLTNAAKHAPGRPVTVGIDWEPDALLLTVVNPVPAGARETPAGHGLAGLDERVRPAGGLLHHGCSGADFRLCAMLPLAPEVAPAGSAGEPAEAGPAVDGNRHGDGSGDGSGAESGADLKATARVRTVTVGFATAVLMFAVLPAGMLVGVR